MGLNTIGGNENLNEKQISQEVKGESYDSEKDSEELAKLHQEASDAKKGQLEEADSLKQMLDMVDEKKESLDQFNEAILDIDISNNKENGGYKNIKQILDKDIDTKEKLELMVKIIHNMKDEIDITYRDNKIEHKGFYCGDRALFFNYLFNNCNDKLNVEESNICLPYGHVMNVIKLRGENYIVDGGIGCFNKIEYFEPVEEKGSWKCIKLKESIKTYEGNLYPFTNFPYTEKLNKEQLEMYTTLNLHSYSYFFTNRLYTVAKEKYGDIKDQQGLQDFLNNYLKKQNEPLKLILDEGDPLANGTKEKQISVLQSQINGALSYEENLKNFNGTKKYMDKIAKNHSDMTPNSRQHTLESFRGDDGKVMDALNIPKEKIPEIRGGLQKKVGTNDKEVMAKYILEKFNNNEPILDDKELDGIVRDFLKAVNMKSGQSNSSLEDYLPNYLSNLGNS